MPMQKRVFHYIEKEAFCKKLLWSFSIFKEDLSEFGKNYKKKVSTNPKRKV
jgi:hypothetical protein